MLYNLRKEMQSSHYTVKELALLLGIVEQSASNKLSEITHFTYPEAAKIKRIMFLQFTFEYLFASDCDGSNAEPPA